MLATTRPTGSSTTPIPARSIRFRCSRIGSPRPSSKAQRPACHGARDVDADGCPMSAWCCSTPATTAASASSPISRATRAASSSPIRRRPSSCTGSRCAAVRVRGAVEVVADGEADAYFATAPGSARSAPMPAGSRAPSPTATQLLERVETLKKSFGEDDRCAPGALVRLPHRAAGHRVLEDSAPTASTTASASSAPWHLGASGCIREGEAAGLAIPSAVMAGLDPATQRLSPPLHTTNHRRFLSPLTVTRK